MGDTASSLSPPKTAIITDDDLEQCTREYHAFLLRDARESRHTHFWTIDEHILLGDGFAATSLEELCKREVRYILNCASTPLEGVNTSAAYYEARGLELEGFLGLPADDDVAFPIVAKFGSIATEFIANAVHDNAKILVHCQAGRNRSACMIAVFLILNRKIRLKKILKLLKHRRGAVLLNVGFVRQLVHLAHAHNLLL